MWILPSLHKTTLYTFCSKWPHRHHHEIMIILHGWCLFSEECASAKILRISIIPSTFVCITKPPLQDAFIYVFIHCTSSFTVIPQDTLLKDITSPLSLVFSTLKRTNSSLGNLHGPLLHLFLLVHIVIEVVVERQHFTVYRVPVTTVDVSWVVSLEYKILLAKLMLRMVHSSVYIQYYTRTIVMNCDCYNQKYTFKANQANRDQRLQMDCCVKRKGVFQFSFILFKNTLYWCRHTFSSADK